MLNRIWIRRISFAATLGCYLATGAVFGQLVFESPLEEEPADSDTVIESPLETEQPSVAQPSAAQPQAFPDFEPVWGGPAYLDAADTHAPPVPTATPSLDTIPNQLGGPAPGFVNPAPAVELNPNYGAPTIESPLEEELRLNQPGATTSSTPANPFAGVQDSAESTNTIPSDPNRPDFATQPPFQGQPPHLQLDTDPTLPQPTPAATPGTPPAAPQSMGLSPQSDSPFQSMLERPESNGAINLPQKSEHPKLEPTPESATGDSESLAAASDGTYTGWWEPMITAPIRGAAQPSQVSVGELVYSALQHSARVRVISDTPLIRDTAVIESDANFDWGIFLETAWNDINDPVGSTLTTGGPPRFQDEQLTYDYGFQKKNRVGGEFSVGQQYGWQQSNSIFFIPNQQGTARLTLNYTQPLMRGRGLMYNTSTVVLAQIGSGAARDELSRELQTYLQEVTEAYWTLYRERGSLLQRQRLYNRGEAIQKQLEVREGLDAIANQVVRAKAAVASRKADLFRAAASVKNAEGQIRALVNSPELGVLDEFELLPIDPPANEEISVTMHDAIEAAVRNRPELHQAMKEIHAASVRLNVSRNEMLPVLDFVINSYVSGLRGDSSIGRAFTDQFNTGSPSYSTGLRFEYPFGNRAARARNQRRILELRQLQHQFRNTLHLLQLEVETAMRETNTTYREIAAKHQAMKAAEGEVALLTDRWKLLPGDDRSASLLLEDLLAAQERLAQQELGFLNAQIEYSISLVNLKRSTGTLLQFERISVTRSEVGGVPELQLHKAANYSSPISHGATVHGAPISHSAPISQPLPVGP